MSAPDWETSKENVQPLAEGRKQAKLSAALKATTRELEVKRVEFEAAIQLASNAEGPHAEDPLAPWIAYIEWLRQSHPKGSSITVDVLEGACRLFLNEARYRGDARYVRIWLLYADTRADIFDVLNFMRTHAIGNKRAVFYEVWACNLERRREYDKAEYAYSLGLEMHAQPKARLERRKKEFDARMRARIRRDRAKLEAKAQKEKARKKLKGNEAPHSESDAPASRRELRQRARTHCSKETSLVSNDSDLLLQSRRTAKKPARGRVPFGNLTPNEAETGIRPMGLNERGFSAQPYSQKTAQPARPSKVPDENCNPIQIYEDPVAQQSYNSLGIEQSAEFPFKSLASRRDIQKENDGLPPSQWAGETLPQGFVADNCRRGMNVAEPAFEVYVDQSPRIAASTQGVPSPSDSRQTTSNAVEGSRSVLGEIANACNVSLNMESSERRIKRQEDGCKIPCTSTPDSVNMALPVHQEKEFKEENIQEHKKLVDLSSREPRSYLTAEGSVGDERTGGKTEGKSVFSRQGTQGAILYDSEMSCKAASAGQHRTEKTSAKAEGAEGSRICLPKDLGVMTEIGNLPFASHSAEKADTSNLTDSGLRQNSNSHGTVAHSNLLKPVEDATTNNVKKQALLDDGHSLHTDNDKFLLSALQVEEEPVPLNVVKENVENKEAFRLTKSVDGQVSPRPCGKKEGVSRPASPTINTKIAWQHVEDMLNQTLHIGGGAEFKIGDAAGGSTGIDPVENTPHETFEIFQDAESDNLPENDVSNCSGSKHLKRVLQPVVDEGDQLQRREDSEKTSKHFDSDDVKLQNSEVFIAAEDVVNVQYLGHEAGCGITSSQELNREGYLDYVVNWCATQPDYYVLQTPSDPIRTKKVLIVRIDEKDVRRFAIQSTAGDGFRGVSQVFIADPLTPLDPNGSINNECEEDENAGVVIKVSDGNLMEFYIYKIVHSRFEGNVNSIPQAIALFDHDAQSCMVLDTVSDASMSDIKRIAPGGILPESLALFFSIDLLRSVESLHQCGIIHNDVNLDNVLLRNDGKAIKSPQFKPDGEDGWDGVGVYLIDFNKAIDTRISATLAKSPSQIAAQASHSGLSHIKPQYRKPATDIWAFDGDCFGLAMCSAQLLGLDSFEVSQLAHPLEYSRMWSSFFMEMASLDHLSTPAETISVMQKYRRQMEVILVKEPLLKRRLQRLFVDVSDARYLADMTQV